MLLEGWAGRGGASQPSCGSTRQAQFPCQPPEGLNAPFAVTSLVRSGRLDVLLVRPVGPLFQIVGTEQQPNALGIGLTGIPIMLIAADQVGLRDRAKPGEADGWVGWSDHARTWRPVQASAPVVDQRTGLLPAIRLLRCHRLLVHRRLPRLCTLSQTPTRCPLACSSRGPHHRRLIHQAAVRWRRFP